MDSGFYALFAGSIAIVALFGSLGVLAFGAFRVSREAMQTLAKLSSESRNSVEHLAKLHATGLENLAAIDRLGVEGMRGVVARSQVRPSVLDPDEGAEPIPSPDKAAGGPNARYIDVGHMATVGPEDYLTPGERAAVEFKE